MAAFYLLLLTPIFGSILMLVIGDQKRAGIYNVLINSLNFIVAIALTGYLLKHGTFTTLRQQFCLDSFNVIMVLLTTFTATTNAIFSHRYMWHKVNIGRINLKQLRLYYTIYQLFVLAILISLTTNNLGILWVGMETATLTTVILVGLYRTKEATEAAWKYFILCTIGIAIALFGTFLIYFSATSIAEPEHRMLWNTLAQYAASFDHNTIKIAFVFILVGYGTKIGLVPMHNWLPDAYSESPAPVTILLSGLLANVSIYALLRCKMIIDLTLKNGFTDNILMTFGVASFVVGAILLQRVRDIKRLFSYSSIEHTGLIIIACALGTTKTTYIALFYLIAHSITKSALFMIIGNITAQTATRIMEKIRGLSVSMPLFGFSLMIATLAITAMPPFAIFNSELMLLIETTKYSLTLTIILIVGLIFALAGILKNIQPVVFGTPTIINKVPLSILPFSIHLGIGLLMAFYLPKEVVQLLEQAALLISGKL